MSTGIYNKLTGYHNRKSIRLPGYDYSQPGYYFITVCIHDRKQRLFGEITNDVMMVNEFGAFTKKCWDEIPVHFPNAQLDEFMVMPNHVHGILRLCASTVGVQNGVSNVGVQNLEPLRNATPTQNQFQHIIPRSIGSIIRGFKIGVTKLVRQQIPNTVVWQRNYYEHIIRDEISLFSIRKYICENPIHWSNDSETHICREIQEFELTEGGGAK